MLGILQATPILISLIFDASHFLQRYNCPPKDVHKTASVGQSKGTDTSSRQCSTARLTEHAPEAERVGL